MAVWRSFYLFEPLILIKWSAKELGAGSIFGYLVGA